MPRKGEDYSGLTIDGQTKTALYSIKQIENCKTLPETVRTLVRFYEQKNKIKLAGTENIKKTSEATEVQNKERAGLVMWQERIFPEIPFLSQNINSLSGIMSKV